MDKAERVVALLRVGPLRDWATTDGRLDEIAAILRREYGDVRREALEEAALMCLARGRSLREQDASRRNAPKFSMRATECDDCAAAIRAAREET